MPSIGYTHFNNFSNSQESVFFTSSQRKKKLKTIKEWSFGLQCNGGKYDGVSIPARKCAITIVGLNEGIFFSFNVTYTKQAQKACELFSKTVKKYAGNSDSIKLWKILPYKELFAEPLGSIDAWIANTFPNAMVESKKLQKGDCFLIERENDSGMQKYNPESLYEEIARSTNKCYLILSCKEDKFKEPQCW